MVIHLLLMYHPPPGGQNCCIFFPVANLRANKKFADTKFQTALEVAREISKYEDQYNFLVSTVFAFLV